MKAFVRCSRILVLCLLCISVTVPVFLLSCWLKHNSDVSEKFVEELSIIKHRTEAQALSALEQEEVAGFREPHPEVHKVDYADPAVNFSDEFRDAHSSGNKDDTNERDQKRQQEDKLPVSVAKEESHVEAVRHDKDVRTMPRRALDEKVKEMKDQVIRAKAYLNFTPANSTSHFVKELKLRIKEVEHAMSQSTRDSRLSRSTLQKMKAMESTLLKASRIYPDCAVMVKKLRAMTYNAEEQARSQRSQEVFLKGLGARTIPKGLHCLSMRLTADYFALETKERELPNKYKLRYPDHYHFAIFSDNILACSVVVNSTISMANEPEKIVFHVVTDSINFPAMSMWFLSNTPGKATVDVDSIDNFRWLSSKYNVTLRKEGSSVDTRYTSELNHLRFYLPEIFPHLNKIVLLDHDVVVQRDLIGLWDINMKGKVNGAVQTCEPAEPSYKRMDTFINFTDPIIGKRFDSKACTWAFGVNVFDLKQWRRRNLIGVYHKFLRLGNKKQLWKAGSLPIGWITFYTHTIAIDKTWHVLGLGYIPVKQEDIDQAAVLHYDGILKPWLDIGLDKYKNFWRKHVNYELPYLQQCNIHE